MHSGKEFKHLAALSLPLYPEDAGSAGHDCAGKKAL
jgi:hypothetical protein